MPLLFIIIINSTFKYFGETFDTDLCNKTCDNCEHVGERQTMDVTKDAKNLVSIGKYSAFLVSF